MRLPGVVHPRGAGIGLSGPGAIESLRPDGSVIRTAAQATALNALHRTPLPLPASACYQQLSHPPNDLDGNAVGTDSHRFEHRSGRDSTSSYCPIVGIVLGTGYW